MRPNKVQKIILIVYGFVFLFICMYVPWVSKGSISVGYAPIWFSQHRFQYQTPDSKETIRFKKEWEKILPILKKKIDKNEVNIAKADSLLVLLRKKMEQKKDYFREEIERKEDYSKYNLPIGFTPKYSDTIGTDPSLIDVYLSDGGDSSKLTPEALSKYHEWKKNEIKKNIEQLEQKLDVSETDFKFYGILAERIDISRLAFEVIGVTVLFGILFIVARRQ